MVHSFNSNDMSKKTKAVQAIDRANRINEILDKAGEALTAEGVEYFLGVVDRQPESEDGGKMHTQFEIKTQSFFYLLDAAIQTRDDLVQLGMWVGTRLSKKEG